MLVYWSVPRKTGWKVGCSPIKVTTSLFPKGYHPTQLAAFDSKILKHKAMFQHNGRLKLGTSSPPTGSFPNRSWSPKGGLPFSCANFPSQATNRSLTTGGSFKHPPIGLTDWCHTRPLTNVTNVTLGMCVCVSQQDFLVILTKKHGNNMK